MRMNDRSQQGHGARGTGQCILTVFAVCAAFWSANPAFAAVVRADVPVSEIAPGAEVVVSFVLGTEGEEINAAEGTVRLEGTGLEITDVRTGSSDIPLWVEAPVVRNGSVRFAGIIPGGRTDDVRLFRLTLRGTDTGSATAAVDGLRVLLNDGNGTETSSRFVSVTIRVREGAAEVPVAPVDKDRTPPEAFVPDIVSDPSLHEGKHVLVFATQDKESGMDGFEVFETRRALTTEEDIVWTPAVSPYVLGDQSLKSYVFVKAVDREGNERIVRMDPRVPLAWYEQEDFAGIMVLILIAAVVAALIIRYIPWRGRVNKEIKS